MRLLLARVCISVTGSTLRHPTPKGCRHSRRHQVSTGATVLLLANPVSGTEWPAHVLCPRSHGLLSWQLQELFAERSKFITCIANTFSQSTICLCPTHDFCHSNVCFFIFTQLQRSGLPLLHKGARARHCLIRDHTKQSCRVQCDSTALKTHERRTPESVLAHGRMYIKKVWKKEAH